MRQAKTILARPILATILLMGATALAADEIPTADALKQLETDKKWQELLAGTTRALALKGDKAVGYDRTEVITLKAEAQLQLKQFSAAATSFELAGKEKTSTPEAADQNRAMSLIAKRTDAQGFKVPTTKTAPARVIDVYDKANRKEAFQALFDISIAEVKATATRARNSPGLPALAKIAKEAADIQFLERAATGSDMQSKAIIDEADATAVRTITKGLETGRQNVARIRTRAEERITQVERATPNRPARIRMRGLDGEDRQMLNEVISQCKSLAGSYKQFVEAIPEPSAALKGLPSDIQSLHDEATEVLNRNYN